MIGEHPMKIGEPFNVCLAPYSRPSILNDLLQYFIKVIADHPKGVAINGTIAPMRYRILPFSGGSDQQVFVDSAIGIPASMFGHSDPFWHTSLDTVEYCDSTELQRVIGFALCISYIFATLISGSLFEVLPSIEEGFYQRLGRAKEMLLNLYNMILTNENENNSNKKIISKQEKALLGTALIETANQYEKGILESLKKFSPMSSQEEELFLMKQNELNQWNENHQSLWINLCKNAGIDIKQITEPEDFKNHWSLSFIGLKNLEDLFPIAMSSQFDKIKVPEPPKLWWGDLHELMNLVGLSLDLKTICAMLTLEYQCFFYPSEVLKFMKFLERKKLIKTI